MNAKQKPRSVGPDFVGIGVQKSGTTWVGDILNQHPDVMIKEKELSFFTHRFHRGYDWYHDWFKDRESRMAGEITVSYMLLPRDHPTRKEFYPKRNPRRALLFWRKQPSARDELHKMYPELKVFAIFRNPVERAWSQYWFWRNRKERFGKKTVPFEQMFRDDGRWIRTHGMYADHLTYWREKFPEMGVYLFDDLKQAPEQLARKLYRFIGVDEDFQPVIAKKVNAGRYEPMPKDVRAMLINHYRDQVVQFAEMTGRDLSKWLQL